MRLCALDQIQGDRVKIEGRLHEQMRRDYTARDHGLAQPDTVMR